MQSVANWVTRAKWFLIFALLVWGAFFWASGYTECRAEGNNNVACGVVVCSSLILQSWFMFWRRLFRFSVGCSPDAPKKLVVDPYSDRPQHHGNLRECVWGGGSKLRREVLVRERKRARPGSSRVMTRLRIEPGLRSNLSKIQLDHEPPWRLPTEATNCTWTNKQSALREARACPLANVYRGASAAWKGALKYASPPMLPRTLSCQPAK